MNKTPELKPCPFCRGEAELDEFEPHKHLFVELPDYPGGAMISCQKCGGRLSFSGKDAKEKVIKAWNTRVTSYNDPPERRFDSFYCCMCGQKPENWDYCPNCGQRLDWSSPFCGNQTD